MLLVGVRSEGGVDPLVGEGLLVAFGQDRTADRDRGACGMALPHEVRRVRGELPRMHRNADDVGILLLCHGGELGRRVEAPQVDHLEAAAHQQLSDRHRADLMLVEPERADHDPAARAHAVTNGSAGRP